MDNKKNEISTKEYVEKNKVFLILFITILILFAFNKYDKANMDTININLENNHIKGNYEDDFMKKVEVFIFNKDIKQLELKEIKIPDKKSLAGDYIKGIIENSTFLSEDMKFLSAYTLNMDGKKIMLIKLSSAFLDLKDDEEVFRGFTGSIKHTIMGYDSSIEDVEIQIDGDKAIK